MAPRVLVEASPMDLEEQHQANQNLKLHRMTEDVINVRAIDVAPTGLLLIHDREP